MEVVGRLVQRKESRRRIGTTHWKSQEGQYCANEVAGGQYCAKEVAGRPVPRTGSRGKPIPRKESRRKVSTAQMESREGHYRAKEVAGGQYRVMEVTGRLVPHTRSRRKVTTAQTKSRGVITAHWRSLIKSGSVVATLRIPDIATLALRGLRDRCYLHIHRQCDRPAAPVCPLVHHRSTAKRAAPMYPSSAVTTRHDRSPPSPFMLLLWPAAPPSVVDATRPAVPMWPWSAARPVALMWPSSAVATRPDRPAPPKPGPRSLSLRPTTCNRLFARPEPL